MKFIQEKLEKLKDKPKPKPTLPDGFVFDTPKGETNSNEGDYHGTP